MRYNSTPSHQQEIFILTVIFAFAVFLRLFHISSPSLWFDELMTMGRVSSNFPTMIHDLAHSPFPPLYYMVVKIFTSLFKTNEFYLRLPSMIFSSMSIIAVYKIGKLLFDRHTGIIAAFLISISTYDINYAQDAKMYSMLWFFSLLSFLYFFKWLQLGRPRDLFLYILFTAPLAYISYVGIFFIIAQNLIYAIFFDPKKSIQWLCVQGILLLIYLPWIKTSFFTFSNKVDIEWLHPIPLYHFLNILFSSAVLNLWPELFQDHNRLFLFSKTIACCMYAALFLLMIMNVFSARKTRPSNPMDPLKNTILLILWALIPCLLFFILDKLYHPILFYRYLGFIHLPLIVLFARALTQCASLVRLVLLLFITAYTFYFSFLPYYSYQLKITSQDWRSAGKLLNEEKEKSSMVDIRISGNDSPIFQRAVHYYISPTKDFQPSGLIKCKILYVVFQNNGPLPDRIDGFKIMDVFHFTGLNILKLQRI